jgi:mevalonate kinase
MVEMVKQITQKKPERVMDFLSKQEALVTQLGVAFFDNDAKAMMQILLSGERNLEMLGVVGKKAKALIEEIEGLGGVAKISGAGGVKNGSGMLLSYHDDSSVLLDFAKKNQLEAFAFSLDKEGVQVE